ncbi:hypothetical protein DV737_g450, partial [Chaetothyriales sp. CBS 132003]
MAPNSTASRASRVRSRRSIQQIQKQALINLVWWYLVVDIIKALHSDDAFFSGLISFYDPPSSSAIYGTGAIASRLARLGITILSVYTALNFLFQLCPIFFSLLLPSIMPYPSLLRLTRTPLLTPSMYEPFFGSLLPSVASKGLAGFWGGFWHQLLRFGILLPSTYIITRTFAFFLMQAIGIVAQAYATRAIGSRAFPVPLRQTGHDSHTLPSTGTYSRKNFATYVAG